MPPLGIITYDAPHLKTEQVVTRLALRQVDMVFFALPFVPRPARTAQLAHRPAQDQAVHTRDLARAWGIPWYDIRPDAALPVAVPLSLVCGAGLLGERLVRSGRILNSHPGLIPVVRGLDAFKWAILKGLPIGNTLHTLDPGVDMGVVHCRRQTPVYTGDTFDTLARRHYELEIDLLCEFETHLDTVSDVPAPTEEPFRRMPAALEPQLLDALPGYIDRAARKGHSA